MSEHYQDDSFWGSKITDYRKCGRLYELKHVQKLPEPGARSADIEFGSAFHLALNDVLEGGGGISQFNIYWDSIKDKGLAYNRLDWEKLKDIGERLIERFKDRHVKHFKPHKMEERVSAVIDGITLEGTPDFIGWYKGVPSVVDFKTSGSEYDKRRAISDEQMVLYAELAKRVYDFIPTQVVYVVFIKGEMRIQTIISPLTEKVQSSTIHNIVETCEDIKSRKFFQRNPQNCIRGSLVCPFWDQCFKQGEKK